MTEENKNNLVAQITQSIGSLKREDWDACAGTSNPFVSYNFLKCLEDSGCVGQKTGWGPVHLTITNNLGELVACVPLYLKSHSRGEYIFDYGWAQAYEQAGGRYYPKLLSAIPFTPAAGPRLLVKPNPNQESLRKNLIAALISTCEHFDIATLSVNFTTETECDELVAANFLRRTDQQFHWYNKEYTQFDDFLGELSSRKRKNIRRERRAAIVDGIEIDRLTGKYIREEHWDAFHHFYLDTGHRKWGIPYLNREFFSLIGETMSDHIVLFLCRRENRYIAGALNFVGKDAIYGRHWGCIEDHAFLHFEACYYQAIEYAIANGISRVEAGAQGPHKIARGYQPTLTYSAHFIRDQKFRLAVADYLGKEQRIVENDRDYLIEKGPFRKSDTLNPD